MAVIGDKDSVMLFKAVGIDVFYETDGDRANRQIKQLAREGYGVIYLTETLYPLWADRIRLFSFSGPEPERNRSRPWRLQAQPQQNGRGRSAADRQWRKFRQG